MAQGVKIQAITGTVTARTPEGQVRELKAGDMVYENEIVETAAGSTLSIIQEDGDIVSLGANDQLLLDESVTSNIDPRDAVIQEVAELQEAIVKTLEEGGDIDDITDEPAAGALAGDHDFQPGYHAGDASKGDVGTYLLDPDSDQRDFEYTQYIGDEPDEEVGETEQVAGTAQASPVPTSPGSPSTPPPEIKITDEDGDLTPADNSVVESTGSSISGTITVSGDAGIAKVTISGQDITTATPSSPIVIIGDEGTLTVTGFDPDSGAVTYDYVEDGETEDHSTGDDSVVDQFDVVVTDVTGATASDTLDIQIIDTAPTAVADTRTVDEDDTGIAGNVIGGVNASADTVLADGATVTGVQANDAGTAEITTGVGGSGIAGTYGTLAIDSDGSYTYALNEAAQALNTDDNPTDTFSYTITDSDGDFSTTTVTFTVNGAGLNTVIAEDDPGSLYSVYLADRGVDDSQDDSWYNNDSTGQQITITALNVDGSKGTLLHIKDNVNNNDNVLGVEGSPRSSAGVPDQIEYDSDAGSSEAILFKFNGNVNEVEFDVSRLYANERGGEQGEWIAYSYNTVVDTGTFLLESGNTGSNIPINTGDLFFDTLKFTALPYADDSGSSKDASDYYITGLSATGPAYANSVYQTAEDTTLTIDPAISLLINDSDPEGHSFTLTAIDNTQLGTAATLSSGATVLANDDGTLNYDPNGAFNNLAAGEVAKDTFEYTITDQFGATDTANATVTIIGKGDSPMSVDYNTNQENETGFVMGGTDGLDFEKSREDESGEEDYEGTTLRNALRTEDSLFKGNSDQDEEVTQATEASNETMFESGGAKAHNSQSASPAELLQSVDADDFSQS